jgi:Bacterial Ig-like domain (group 1)
MIFISEKVVKISRLALAGIALVTMSACGGGGGSPGVTNKGGGGNGTPNGTTTKPATAGTLTVSVLDSSSKAVTQVTSGQTVSLRAKFTDSSGNPLSNAIVKFSASDSTAVVFTPDSASALTGDDGVAVLSLKSASLETAGPLTLSATATSGAITGSGSINVNFGASSVTVEPLSFVTNQTVPLAAFNTIGLNIPLKSSSQSLTSITGITINASSDCKGDDKADIALGSFSNGVLSATYTNRGCTRGTDKIVVSVGSSSQSISLQVGSANIGTIRYVGADVDPAPLVLKGTGGTGRKESTVLTFKVVDQNNIGLSGVEVSFTADATTGGITLAPLKATSDASGNVTTTVSSGTIPLPVRISAIANRNNVTVSGQSNQLNIATGLPMQKFMSMSFNQYNFEGWGYDGKTITATVLMADQFGNPVSDNTAINFVAEGGSIQSSCLTKDGGCSVTLRSQEARPANGRVTVLAYAQGIEDFVDVDGDGKYTSGSLDTFTDLPDPFLDVGTTTSLNSAPDLGVIRSLKTTFSSDEILGLGLVNVNNTGTLDGIYSGSKGDKQFPYNAISGYSSVGDGKWGVNFIRRSAEVVFSGSFATLKTWNGTAFVEPSSFAIPGLHGTGCSAQRVDFKIADENNNPMPYDTTLSVSGAVKLVPASPAVLPSKVLSTNAIGGTIHSVYIAPDPGCAAGSFNLNITTPAGNTTTYSFSSAP